MQSVAKAFWMEYILAENLLRMIDCPHLLVCANAPPLLPRVIFRISNSWSHLSAIDNLSNKFEICYVSHAYNTCEIYHTYTISITCIRVQSLSLKNYRKTFLLSITLTLWLINCTLNIKKIAHSRHCSSNKLILYLKETQTEICTRRKNFLAESLIPNSQRDIYIWCIRLSFLSFSLGCIILNAYFIRL